MVATAPKEIAAALQYSPQVQGYARRSQYLTEALKAMQESGQTIKGGWGELAAKLGATALLARGEKRANAELVAALKGERAAKVAGMTSDLEQWGSPAVKTPPIAPSNNNTDPNWRGAQETSPQATPARTAPPAPQTQASPEDVDALARMLATEAIGEGPIGMAAAGHVALNRAKTGYGGAKSVKEVVYAPSQFEGMSRANQIKPEDYQTARQIAEGVLTGNIPDPTNGAINFLNPELQAQLGRQQPSWAPQGQGQRIGRHVFYGGKPDVPQQQAQFVSQPGPVADQNFQVSDQPFQVAAAGGLQLGMVPGQPPSAPAPPQGGGGMTPGAGPPQAQAPGVAYWQPTPQQIELTKQLLASDDPEEYARGVAMFNEIKAKRAEPAAYDVQMVNGVPTYIPKTPGQGQVQVVGVPEQARNRTVSAAEAGIPAPPGTMLSVSPTGQYSVITKPEGGQQVVSAPGKPYTEAPIPGSAKDPTSPENLVRNEGMLRDDFTNQIKPFIVAREGYQKVVQAAATGTPAGDIALVFGYMKTLDPTSTVREGEQASVKNSGTIDQSIVNTYNQLLTGKGSLTPEQRAQFADSARRQFEVYAKTADSLTRHYTDIAKSYGFEPGRIVQTFEPIEPFTPGGGKPPPVPRAAHDAHQTLIQRGQFDAKKPFGDRANPFVVRDEATLRALDRPEHRGQYIITPDGKLAVIE